MGQWLGRHAPNSGGLSWTLGQGIVSHMLQLGVCTPQLKGIAHATTNTQGRQINKYLKKKKKQPCVKINLCIYSASSLRNVSVFAFRWKNAETQKEQ